MVLAGLFQLFYDSVILCVNTHPSRHAVLGCNCPKAISVLRDANVSEQHSGEGKADGQAAPSSPGAGGQEGREFEGPVCPLLVPNLPSKMGGCLCPPLSSPRWLKAARSCSQPQGSGVGWKWGEGKHFTGRSSTKGQELVS